MSSQRIYCVQRKAIEGGIVPPLISIEADNHSYQGDGVPLMLYLDGVVVAVFDSDSLLAWWKDNLPQVPDSGLGSAKKDNGMYRYGNFYKPLTGKLRAKGIMAMNGSRGGYTGRYRRFKTGFEDMGVAYCTKVGTYDDKTAWIRLRIDHEDCQSIGDAIKFRLPDLDWLQYRVVNGDDGAITAAYFTVECTGSVYDTEAEVSELSGWMESQLTAMHQVMQPVIDEIMELWDIAGNGPNPGGPR